MAYPIPEAPRPMQMPAMQEPLVATNLWELRLEEGDAVRYEAAFLVDETTRYQIAAFGLFCLIPIAGQVFFLPLLLLMLACCGRKLLDRVNRSKKCVITHRSLYIYRSKPACCCLGGLCWGHEQRYIPLDKIQDINISQSWLEGKYGIFTVKIETAGQSGPESGPEGCIQGMGDPVGFRQALLEARGRAPAPVQPSGDRELGAGRGMGRDLVQVEQRLDRIEQKLDLQVTALTAIEKNTRP